MSAVEKPLSETARRILEAADELLSELGYAGASMRDVAERAGVNKASVFYHFSSKEELFERVLQGYYDAHMEALAGAFAGEEPVRERLHRMIDAYVDFMAENRRYPRLVQQQVAGVDTRHLIERNLRQLFDWTTRALAELVPDAGPLAARHFFVTFSAMVINYFTYTPVLGEAWGERDPMGEEALSERRAHVHWMVDVALTALEREARP
jgi:TetR/AcrR family transcriptional regulator